MDSLQQRRGRKIDDFQKNLDNFYHFRRTGVDTIVSDSTLAKTYAVGDLPPAQPPYPKRFIDVLSPDKQHYLVRRAKGHISNAKTQANNTHRAFEGLKQSLAEHENEIHQKLLYAFACILFLFIGAPMGALIRKGGFGWPVLVSVVLFMTFFVLNLIGGRLATNMITVCWFGSWLPMIFLFPLSMWLTYRAMNDASGISIKGITTFFSTLGGKLRFWKRNKS
jgi:lipopolysaccharide export system permease protein